MPVHSPGGSRPALATRQPLRDQEEVAARRAAATAAAPLPPPAWAVQAAQAAEDEREVSYHDVYHWTRTAFQSLGLRRKLKQSDYTVRATCLSLRLRPVAYFCSNPFVVTSLPDLSSAGGVVP